MPGCSSEVEFQSDDVTNYGFYLLFRQQNLKTKTNCLLSTLKQLKCWTLKFTFSILNTTMKSVLKEGREQRKSGFPSNSMSLKLILE